MLNVLLILYSSVLSQFQCAWRSVVLFLRFGSLLVRVWGVSSAVIDMGWVSARVEDIHTVRLVTSALFCGLRERMQCCEFDGAVCGYVYVLRLRVSCVSAAAVMAALIVPGVLVVSVTQSLHAV